MLHFHPPKKLEASKCIHILYDLSLAYLVHALLSTDMKTLLHDIVCLSLITVGSLL